MIYSTCNSNQQSSFYALLKMVKTKNDGCEDKSCSRGPFALEYFFKPGKYKTMKNNFFIKTTNKKGYNEHNNIINGVIANACKIRQVYFARWKDAIDKRIPCKSEKEGKRNSCNDPNPNCFYFKSFETKKNICKGFARNIF